MMNSRRRQKGDNYKPEATRTISQNRKPPLGNWQPTVPSWEKKFCTSVGLVSWRKIVETSKCMHLYENVVNWNDSAGQEAFQNAKNRFYARMHGLPCDISLPDPDIYIDEIDWNSKIDPEFLLDLDREFVVPAIDGEDEHVVIFGSTLLSNHGFSSNGWGETEEDIKRAIKSSSNNNENTWEQKCSQDNGAIQANGWGDSGNNSWLSIEGNGGVSATGWVDFSNNSWCWNDGNGVIGDNKCGFGWNNSWGWDQDDNNYEAKNWKDRDPDNWGTWDTDDMNCWGQCDNNSEAGNWKDRGHDKVWGTGDINNRKREGTGGYIPRYKTSRFGGDNYLRNYGWRYWKERKRGNFVQEQQPTDKRPSSMQWNLINSCGHVSQHA